MHEPELTRRERALLQDVYACEVPEDFADSVLDRLFDPEEFERSEASASTPVPQPERQAAPSRTRVMIAAAAVAMAAALVGWIVASIALGPSTLDEANRAAALQATTQILEEHCGTCHRGTDAPADARAAFDLDEARWVDGLGADGLQALADRVDARRDIEPEQRARVQSFVRAELEARRG